MRILMDIDGVLRNLVGQIEKIYDREYPNKWRKPITAWGLHEFFEIGHGIYGFAFKKFAYECFGQALAYPGAVRFVLKLVALGHTVVMCTSQNKHTTVMTAEWLYEHKFDFHELYITGQDHKKSGKNMEGDIMIDDGLHNLEKFNGLKICFEQPWNEGFTDGFRTSNYDEILQLVADHQEMLVDEGRKFSKGKPRWSLLPWDTLSNVVDVLTAGAEKYSPDNWKKVPEGRIEYMDAIMRHLVKLEKGEYIDKDSGLPGTGHLLCCALFYAWFVDKEHADER